MGLSAMKGVSISRGVYLVEWSGLKNGASVGPWNQLANLPDRSLTVSGTWGPGATIVIEGTNTLVCNLTSATLGFTLNDSRGFGNALSFTTGKVATILENVNAIRPRITSLTSTVTPKLTVRILAESRLR